MPHNVGPLDRAVRVLLGLAVLSLALVGPRTAWAYLGFAPLLTGVVGYCPLYHALHVDPNRRGLAAR